MPLEIERRWLVIPKPWYWPKELLVSESHIAQTSLLHPEEAAGTIERVRTRLHIGNGMGKIQATHTHTIKRPTGKRLVRREEEREITEAEMNALMADRKHPDCQVIQKVRRVFEWKGKTFELDSLMQPVRLHVLECELDNEDEPVELPPFLDIVREITEEPGWTNSEIAFKDWKHPDRLIPGVALDRLVWQATHWRQETPDVVPAYSTRIQAAEDLIKQQFAEGEAINVGQAITGRWAASTSRFFTDDDPKKRHFDDTAFRLSAGGYTLPHAVAILVAVNGVGDLDEAEWIDRWAWDWEQSDHIKAALGER